MSAGEGEAGCLLFSEAPVQCPLHASPPPDVGLSPPQGLVCGMSDALQTAEGIYAAASGSLDTFRTDVLLWVSRLLVF